MRLDDGFPTTIEFDGIPGGIFGTLLWEKEVTPPGMQGGGPVETSTMRNIRWRTRSPKKLKTLSEMSLTIAYDPECYDDLNSLLQVNQQIAIAWPDASYLYFWGWIDEFTPNELTEGEQPDADVTIIPSNRNDEGAEIDPEYVPPTS